jgi:N-acetyl-gamma-glutamyl-phosphate reductase
VSEATLGVGLIGARGYAGRELLRLIDAHDSLHLAYAASRSSAGRPVREVQPLWPGDEIFIDAGPDAVAHRESDVVVLALPNGVSHQYLPGIEGDAVVVDLSADWRFDSNWAYGLPELHRGDLVGARRIANPGCYATAAMLALAPISTDLAGEPSVFGVSGYSGAGTVPSERNDPERLRDNVIPYSITGHIHEREICHQMGQPVRFAPSVAPFERGLVVTVVARLETATDADALLELYRDAYAHDPLIEFVAEIPLPRDAAGRVQATIGGFSVDPADPRRIGVAVALDNLLKGASSQAVQNLNLALGLDPLQGLT